MKQIGIMSCLVCLLFWGCSKNTVNDTINDDEQQQTGQPADNTHDMDNMTIGLANIQHAQLIQDGTGPVKLSVLVKGYLADGCTEIHEISKSRNGDLFNIKITTMRPKDKVCTQATVPFERSVSLDAEELKAGNYTFEVNGFRGAFKLDVDNYTR